MVSITYNFSNQSKNLFKINFFASSWPSSSWPWLFSPYLLVASGTSWVLRTKRSTIAGRRGPFGLVKRSRPMICRALAGLALSPGASSCWASRAPNAGILLPSRLWTSPPLLSITFVTWGGGKILTWKFCKIVLLLPDRGLRLALSSCRLLLRRYLLRHEAFLCAAMDRRGFGIVLPSDQGLPFGTWVEVKSRVCNFCFLILLFRFCRVPLGVYEG